MKCDILLWNRNTHIESDGLYYLRCGALAKSCWSTTFICKCRHALYVSNITCKWFILEMLKYGLHIKIAFWSRQMQIFSQVSFYERPSPLFSQVYEEGGRLEGINMKGLGTATADMVISKIHSRLTERPAGTVLTTARANAVWFNQGRGTFHLLFLLLLFLCVVVLLFFSVFSSVSL